MEKIGFSINKLIVNDNSFDLSFFDTISEKDKDPEIISKEVISVKVFEREIIENRFVGLYFEGWEKYPYSAKVIKSDSESLEEIDNPRSPSEIELNEQFFILVDVDTQRIYISNQKKVKSTIDWIANKTKSNIVIKPLFDESSFIDKIRSISEINFSIDKNNLFNAAYAGTLSKVLAKDMLDYEADEAKLSLIYKKNKPIDKIKDMVNRVIGARFSYQTLTIIGRMDNGIESVLNLDGLVNKMIIDKPLEDETKKIKKEDVFDALILKIKQNEKTNEEISI